METDYFFSGAVLPLTVGETAGFALVSLVSSFFESFAAGLEAGEAGVVGDAVEDGLETTIGVVAAGEVDGVAAAGLLVPGSQALEIAAMPAKTVSRNDLLIVFSSLF